MSGQRAPSSPETKARAALLRALEADLIGPFAIGDFSLSEEQARASREVLRVTPTRRYFTGFLSPQDTATKLANEEGQLDGDLTSGEEEASDAPVDVEPVSSRPAFFPVSMGLTFYLPSDAENVTVDVEYADYDQVSTNDLDEESRALLEYKDRRPSMRPVASDNDDAKERASHVWFRVPHKVEGIVAPLDNHKLFLGIPVEGSRGLLIFGEIQDLPIESSGDAGGRVVSLWLVNHRTPEKTRDLSVAFQVKLAVHCKGGFLSRPNWRGSDEASADEEKLQALQFREEREWAVGRNTSIEAPTLEDDGKVRCLRTTFLPSYEVPKVDSSVENVELRMERLGQANRIELVRSLRALTDGYATFVGSQAALHFDRPNHREARNSLVSKMKDSLARMQRGIALLEEDDLVLDVFQRTQRVMERGARQLDKARGTGRYDCANSGFDTPRWRAFQLGFLLQSLASFARPEEKDRNIADLIYFPTGGGKTEAYLGVITFALLWRRLDALRQHRADEGRGVAVLLRYTLRLLTIDQLGRAATLMCALEDHRKASKDLGSERFAVGLWVGSASTPNTIKGLVAKRSESHSRESFFPLHNCPWCGSELSEDAVRVVDDVGRPSKSGSRVTVVCASPTCAFSERMSGNEGLPVLFVDEQIYNELPSFIIATVDKFAQLPWRAEAGKLFGKVDAFEGRNYFADWQKPPRSAQRLKHGLRAPDLILQDELHLISGPLGTMVGLYEAAVDVLCKQDGLSPKIICSTATVRSAAEQVQAIFARQQMQLFPPQGITDGDSYFSRKSVTDAGRLYVGVAAPGRSFRGLTARVYTALLVGAASLEVKFGPEVADAYRTLLGYFNSLRELGGTRRLVTDEVAHRVKQYDSDISPPLQAESTSRHLLPGPKAHPWASSFSPRDPLELTSRANAAGVKIAKARLDKQVRDKEGLDVVLASNMISVGLDIDRLGLMVVTGQPKTTSEYIQATSRVGRSKPGLVIACLHTFRPRDRSHYERFVAYHSSFYREVEATSVTPFSHQALARGLAGTLVTMVRHGISEMTGPEAFVDLDKHRQEANALLEELVQRAKDHRGRDTREDEERLANFVHNRGQNFLDAWQSIASAVLDEGGGIRRYSKNEGTSGGPVLYAFEEKEVGHKSDDEMQFQIPMSMRDVEAASHLWVQTDKLDRRGK